SQDIIEKIETGEYSDENKAWKIYEYKLRSWALENGYEEDDVDSLMQAQNVEYNKISEAANSGNLAGLENKEEVKTALNQMVNNSQISAKINNIINEILRFKRRMTVISNEFDLDINLEKINNEVDMFVNTVKQNDFENADQAEAYMDMTGFKLNKTVNVKLGEMLLLMNERDDFSLESFMGNIETVFTTIETGLEEEVSGDENLSIFADYSYDDFELHRIMEVVENYLDKNEAEMSEKLLLVKQLYTLVTNMFINGVDDLNYTWNDSQVEAMGKLLSSVMILDIDKPLPTMDPAGELFDTRGRLKQKNSVFEHNAETFPYEIVDPSTGYKIAHVRLSTEDDESAQFNGLPEKNIKFWDNTTDTDKTITKNEFETDYLDTETWFFQYREGDDNIRAIEALSEEKIVNYLNAEAEFEGIMKPPVGADEDISKFETEPLLMVLGHAWDDTSEYDSDKFMGDPINMIKGKIAFNPVHKKWFIVNTKFDSSDDTPDFTSPKGDNEYWLFDFSNARTWDIQNDEEIPFNPNEIDNISSNIFEFHGNLIFEKEDNNMKYYRAQIHWIEQPFDFNDGNSTIFQFVSTGILDYSHQDTDTGKDYYVLRDMDGMGMPIAYIGFDDTYSENNTVALVTWLDDKKNKLVTVGNPNSETNSVDAVWSEELGQPLVMVDDSWPNTDDTSFNEYLKEEEGFFFADSFDYRDIKFSRNDNGDFVISEYKLSDEDVYADAYNTDNKLMYVKYDKNNYDLKLVLDQINTEEITITKIHAVRNYIGSTTIDGELYDEYVVELFGYDMSAGGEILVNGSSAADALDIVVYEDYLGDLYNWSFNDWEVNVNLSDNSGPVNDSNVKVLVNEAREIIFQVTKEDGSIWEDRFQFNYWEFEKKLVLGGLNHGIGTENYKSTWLDLELIDFTKLSEYPANPGVDDYEIKASKTEYFGDNKVDFTVKPYTFGTNEAGFILEGVSSETETQLFELDITLCSSEPKGLFMMKYNTDADTPFNSFFSEILSVESLSNE
ncbi:MAG: hypothetical protein ACQESP_01320, partial [Candidatus Muiribacteriota bacterium]